MNTNLENEFVPYEQALALKELGFDEPCLCIYNKHIIDHIFMSNINDINNQPKNSELSEISISAPTFSQCFKWFREKYKLHSTITSISQESWQWHITRPNESLGKLYDEDFYTYEEAELQCLIKLIEIVKK